MSYFRHFFRKPKSLKWSFGGTYGCCWQCLLFGLPGMCAYRSYTKKPFKMYTIGQLCSISQVSTGLGCHWPWFHGVKTGDSRMVFTFLSKVLTIGNQWELYDQIHISLSCGHFRGVAKQVQTEQKVGSPRTRSSHLGLHDTSTFVTCRGPCRRPASYLILG